MRSSPLPFLLVLGLLASAAPVPAQLDLTDFTFAQLRIVFLPHGLPASGDDIGSALEILADRVEVTGEDAVDARHCIDDQDDCSISQDLRRVYSANRNGQVEASEVANFSQVAAIGVATRPTIVSLNNLLQRNISVDGVTGNRPRVAQVAFAEAEGPIDSPDPLLVSVTITVEYQNDKKAKHHTVEVRDLDLKSEGFAYANAVWTVRADDRWTWKKDEAQPESARQYISSDGWFSTQAQFESATEGTLTLKVDQTGGKKRAPGFEAFILLAALAALVPLSRRRS